MGAYVRTTSTPKASLSRPITNFHHGAAIRRALLLGMTMFLAMCLGASLPLSEWFHAEDTEYLGE